jgi:benzoylformate decarboxylase
MTTVCNAILDLLRAHNLTTFFGNPGSSELALLQDFPEDFRYFLGLQEMIPVGMADAYAQITGRPALVNLHTAPGMGNAQGQLYNAYCNKTPLIVTAGNQRRNMQNQYCLLTNIEPTTVPRPFVKWAAEPAIASEAPAVLARAIHLATTPPMGPVFVSLPMDDMPVELDDAQAADIAVVRERSVTHAAGFPAELAERICARVEAATSPALIVGGDVERYGAWESVVGLAERIQSVVWSAPLTGWSGFPENHPLYQGTLPPGAGWISQALAGHDLLIAVGTPVFRYYPQVPGPYLPEGATMIHITTIPTKPPAPRSGTRSSPTWPAPLRPCSTPRNRPNGRRPRNVPRFPTSNTRRHRCNRKRYGPRSGKRRPPRHCGSARPAATSSPSLTPFDPVTRSRICRPRVADSAGGYPRPSVLSWRPPIVPSSP